MSMPWPSTRTGCCKNGNAHCIWWLRPSSAVTHLPGRGFAMRTLSWRYVGMVTVLVIFTASTQFAAPGCCAEAGGQKQGTSERTNVGVDRVIEDRMFP